MREGEEGKESPERWLDVGGTRQDEIRVRRKKEGIAVKSPEVS